MPGHYGDGKKGKGPKKKEISLLKRYIKMVDPNSVVRESELMSHPAAGEFMRRLRKSRDPASVERDDERMMRKKGRR